MPVTFTAEDFQEAPTFTDADFAEQPAPNIQLSPYERAQLPAIPGGPRPETGEGYTSDFARVLATDLPRDISAGLSAAWQPIEAGAARALNLLKASTATETGQPADTAPYAKPGEPLLNLPLAAPNEQGVIPSLSRFASGLTTPGNLLTLPFAGELKPVQAYFAAQSAAAVPETIQALERARTPAETRGAATDLGANLLMTGLMGRGLLKERPTYASQVRETAPVYGDVRPQPEQGTGTLPVKESGEGIQPQTTQTTEAQQQGVLLDPEHERLIQQEGAEMDVPIGIAGEAPRPGQFMGINRQTGSIDVYPQNFSKWLQSVPEEQRAAAVSSRLAEERIHLSTSDADAGAYWNTLTAPEKAAFRRIYSGNFKGEAGGVKFSDTDLGHEALRYRVQQLSRMAPSEIAEAAKRERWTVKTLQVLADFIRTVREKLGTKASGAARAILDRVQENLANSDVAEAVGASPEAVPAAVIKESDSTKEFRDLIDAGNVTGGNMLSTKAGLGARSLDDLKALANLRKTYADRVSDMNAKTREASQADRMNLAMQTIAMTPRAQLPREAIEVATGVGGWTEADTPLGDRPLDWRKHPDVAQWLKENAEKLGISLPDELKRTPAATIKKQMELYLPKEPELERAGATELGAQPFTTKDLEGAGAQYLQGEKGRAPTLDFEGFSAALRSKYGDLKPGQLFELYQDQLYKKLFSASGAQIEAAAKAADVKANRVIDPIAPQPLFRLQPEGASPEVTQQMRAETTGNAQRQRYRNLVIGRIAEKLLNEAAPETKAPTRTTVSPEDIASPSGQTKGQVFFDIATGDLDRPGVLAQRLVQDARRSKRDPVSMTKRVTLLVDKQSGKAFLVSTYPHGRSGAMLVDPSLSTVRAHRPLTQILGRYRPVASMLLDEPVQNFKQKFDTLGDFEAKLGTDARRATEQAFEEPLREGEQPEPGSWEKGAPITDAEATSIMDHITSEVGRFDTVDDVKDSLMALKEDTNPQVLSGYRKLADRLLRNNPDLSDEGLINQLAQNIYDNHAAAPDLETFVKRTMAQGGATYRPSPETGPTPEVSETAKELTMRARRPPTSVLPSNVPPEAAALLGSQPAPPVPDGTPFPVNVNVSRGTLSTRPDLQPPVQPGAGPTDVPSVQSGVRETAPRQTEPPDSPAAFNKALQAAKDETERVAEAVKLLTTRATLVGDISRTIDQVDNRKNNEATQAETDIRLASVEKPSGVGRFTQPWQRGNREVLSAANAVVEAQFSPGKLNDFLNDLTAAKQNAAQMAQSTSWRERRLAKAYERDIAQSEAEVNYAQNHWKDPELQSTARRIKVALDKQYALEKAKGFDLNKEEGYIPHRLLGVWGGADTLFQLPRVLGTKYRAPRTFSTHYEALAAGPYMRVTHDSASLVGHRVRQGLGNIYRHEWRDGLKAIQLPGGSALAIEPTYGTHGPVSPDPAYRVLDTGLGALAVHEDIYKPLRGLLAPSYFDNAPIAGAALRLEQQLKHGLLIGDFFHFARMFYYGTSIVGKQALGGGKAGWSVLNIADRNTPEAVRKGVISQKDADWANEKIHGNLSRRDIVEMAYQKFGANLGKVSDALYKDLLTELTPTAGPVRRGLARVADPSVGRYNRFLFEQMTRGLMAESIVREFERQTKALPDASPDALLSDITRDVNERFGNLGRQGMFKSKTAQDFARFLFLAPNWVEGMARTEARSYARVSGAASLIGQRRGVTTLGTTGRSVGRAMLFMFGLTQAINYLTRGQSTFQNDEAGHKLDAWIPSWGSNKEGFWFSPMSVFMELSHDLYRLGTAKIQNDRPVGETLIDILANKESPISRALVIMGTGRNPRGEQITSTFNRFVTEPAKAMVPLPITFGKYAQAAGHALAPGVVPPTAPGAMQRQAFGTAGLKIEPAQSAASNMHRLAEKFMRDEGLKKESGWAQVQTAEPSYTKLRQAIRDQDFSKAKKVYNELVKSRTPQQIAAHMKQASKAPFTGSAPAEKEFIGSLDDKQLNAYSEAQDRLLDDYEAFADWFGSQE